MNSFSESGPMGLEFSLKPSEIFENKERHLEISRQIGDFYVSLVSGNKTIDEGDIDGLDGTVRERAREIFNSVQTNQEQQGKLVEAMNFSGTEVLKPALSRLPEAEAGALLKSGQYRLERLSNGVFAIFMDMDSMSKITKGQALAVKVTGGVSFILLRDLPDDITWKQSYLEENIPHESHHILWNFLRQDKLINNSEEDEEWQAAFSMYQDELIARLSSEGYVGGYSHFMVCGPDYRAEVQARDPEKVKAILDMVGDLNGFLEDEFEPERVGAGVEKRDLIYTVMQAKSFNELREEFHNLLIILRGRPKSLPK